MYCEWNMKELKKNAWKHFWKLLVGIQQPVPDEQFWCLLYFFVIIITEVHILYKKLQKRNYNWKGRNHSFQITTVYTQEWTDEYPALYKGNTTYSSTNKRTITQIQESPVALHAEDKFSPGSNLTEVKVVGSESFKEILH